jgi:septum formation protein
MLVHKIEGDFHNAVGFPAAAFFNTLGNLLEEEVDFLNI